MGATLDTTSRLSQRLSQRPNRRDFITQALGLGALLSRSGCLLAQERLPTRPIPGTGESLPIIGFGSSKPVLESPTEGTEPIANVLRMLLEYGGRVIDTSPRTEEIDRDFGLVLQDPEVRDRLFLAAKININGEQAGIDHRGVALRMHLIIGSSKNAGDFTVTRRNAPTVAAFPTRSGPVPKI